MRDRLLGLILVCCGCFGEADPIGDGGSGSADTSASESGGGVMATCADYCALITDSCQADFQQYAAGAACEAVCAAFEQGEPDAMSGNSLECRSYHATNAAEDPEGHCRHAGPSGDSVCGGNCESFCTLAEVLCTGEFQQFADFEECITMCQMYPPDPPYSSNEVDGNSFACRMYHLTLASTEPDPHCTHIDLDSPPCADMMDTGTGTTG